MNHANQPGGLRCHDPYACAMGQKPCPTPTECNCAPTGQELESQREKAAKHYGTMALEARAAAKYQCADCKTPLRPGYICGACDSFGAEEIEAPVLQAAPQAPAAVAVPWDNFPAYLIDHCEGDTITEEGLQRALAAMLADPQYAPAQEHATHGEATAAQLETAWRDGWAKCRDAEQVGQEAEDWAFGQSTTNSAAIDAAQAQEGATQEQDIQQRIAGAIFSFAGYLTSIPKARAFTVSECHEAGAIVQEIQGWADEHGLSLDEARVQDWQRTDAPAQEGQ